MKQYLFERKNEVFWQEFEASLQVLSQRRGHRASLQSTEPFPNQYRQLCHHLSLARARHYSPALVNRLEQMVNAAHQIYYRRKTHLLASILVYFTSGFPQAVRREAKWVIVSSLLFFGSLLGMFVTVLVSPDMVYTMLDGQQLAGMESMYQPGENRIGRERAADSDFEMFGYYIFNNTSIGLRTFASGLLFAVGTVVILLFNGLYIGAIAGHLTYIGYTATFWPFVAGHSSIELMAIALSGAAGFKLGFSIISPGRKSRMRSLRDAAKQTMNLMYGVASMFILAAFIEAYWSSMSDVDPTVKYTVGIGLWVLLIAYFIFAGRHREA